MLGLFEVLNTVALKTRLSARLSQQMWLTWKVCFLVMLMQFFPSSLSATHDEIGQCGLIGIYKTRQSVLQSPNFPNNYLPKTCWDYVVRSPYRCPTTFHIQFLHFDLESSLNCTHDFLAIGLEHNDDDMDVLCGVISGIKKYRTPDGVLRLRFFSDDSPWTTSKGFKILVTRLACEREDVLRDLNQKTEEDSEEVQAPSHYLAPPLNQLSEGVRNLSWQQEQPVVYPLLPLFGFNYPQQQQLPVSSLPIGFGNSYMPPFASPPIVTAIQQTSGNDGLGSYQQQQPCITPKPGVTHLPQFYLRTNEALQQPNYRQQLPHVSDQYVKNSFRPITPQAQLRTATSTAATSNPAAQTRQQIGGLAFPSTAEQCCVSSFNQKRFYLSSPGFPRTAFTSLLPTQQRDCFFEIEKFTQTVCRLRIEFKFFDFGQTYSGSGGSRQGNIQVAIGTSKDLCTEDFIEVDGERFCGCRTNYVYTAFWGLGKKTLRMRVGYSGIPSSGFLLDIFQEECQGTQFLSQQSLGPLSQTTGLIPQNAFGGLTMNPSYNNIGQVTPLLYPAQQQQQIVMPQQQPFFPTYMQSIYNTMQPQLAQLQQLPQQQVPLTPLAMNYYNPTQFRASRGLEYARARSLNQPYSVVETNSTRKEFYYFDGDQAFAQGRQSGSDGTNNNGNNNIVADDPDDSEHVVANTQFQVGLRGRCNFDAMDTLRLSVDYYWISKPTCYSPQGRWFTHLFG